MSTLCVGKLTNNRFLAALHLIGRYIDPSRDTSLMREAVSRVAFQETFGTGRFRGTRYEFCREPVQSSPHSHILLL